MKILRRTDKEIEKEFKSGGGLCMCGCGSKTKWNTSRSRWNLYLRGHNTKGKHLSEEHKTKIVQNNPFNGVKGEKHFNYGRKHSEATKRKISENSPKPFLGRKHSEVTKKKISDSHKGKRLGYKHSKDTLQKISLAQIKEKNHNYGKLTPDDVKLKISMSLRNEKNGFYGKKHSEKTKRKLSMYCGNKASGWQGGISTEPYCDAWADKEYKEDTKRRDNYECQNPHCKKIKWYRNLCIHHIDYNKKNCRPENLITLCRSCNSRANKNRDSWVVLYDEIILSKSGDAL